MHLVSQEIYSHSLQVVPKDTFIKGCVEIYFLVKTLSLKQAIRFHCIPLFMKKDMFSLSRVWYELIWYTIGKIKNEILSLN